MAIDLSNEARSDLTAAIKQYFLDERDEEIGDLQASFLLDFVVETIGPAIYNQGIRDAHQGFLRALADLDTTLYVADAGYTKRGRAGGGRKGKR